MGPIAPECARSNQKTPRCATITRKPHAPLMPTPWLADLSRSFKRHRQGRPGWIVEVMRDRLRVVSDELPPRPGEIAAVGKRRAITLVTPPGPATAAAALAEACGIFDAVLAGAWQWPDPDAPAHGDPARLGPENLSRLRVRLRVAVVGEQISERTWQRMYRPYLLRLEEVAAQRAWDEQGLLEATLKRWQPNSRARQMAHDRFRALWKEAGWPWPEAVLALRGNGRAAADPAGVIGFNDQEIDELRRRISTSRLTAADLVAWDCLIVFGLRPAELKGLVLQEQGGALVAKVSHEKKSSRGKVGARSVPAVPPKGWPVDCYDLLSRWRAHGLTASLVAMASPGERMAKQLSRLHKQQQATGALRASLTPYGLRHAFAIRLGVDLGLSVRESAELMGHSPAVHLQTYGRQLDRPKLLAKVAGLVAKI